MYCHAELPVGLELVNQAPAGPITRIEGKWLLFAACYWAVQNKSGVLGSVASCIPIENKHAATMKWSIFFKITFVSTADDRIIWTHKYGAMGGVPPADPNPRSEATTSSPGPAQHAAPSMPPNKHYFLRSLQPRYALHSCQ